VARIYYSIWQKEEVKSFIDKTQICSDAFIYKRGDLRGDMWYLRIAKQPHWNKSVVRSLKTGDKEKALKKGTEIYNEIVSSSNAMMVHIFSPEDRVLATRKMALGNLSEDKFKNIMMYQGYEVYKPVEDIWGSDFVLFKGNDVLKVQLKSSNMDNPSWALANNHRTLYKELCTHMAFIHLPTQKIWLVPCNELPNISTIKHTLFVQSFAKYEVNCTVPVA